MYTVISLCILTIIIALGNFQEIYETDVNFRVEAGTRTCFFEKGKAGQIMEFFYQVIDGQHGDLDISVEVIDPEGNKLVSDYKKSENSIIMDLEHDGDYVFCLDNTYSIMNSKLVFVYVVVEDRKDDSETEVTIVNDGDEEEIVEWLGQDRDGSNYTIEVSKINESLIRTLNHVVKARHMLDMYSATKSRDSYLASEDTFIVDCWSGFQITLMSSVGFLQVYMIKKLFDRPNTHI
ncbi:transmembrane emp24 domain-containing protein 1-like [Danaus plexippus]|uniref:transmembrane emp24 domain-containing protein 1-like n=1 Tax=Danaus plexippus TaxID=13037 RepID=UPI002AB0C3B5|nr:transmembrane emp24 domain-containing protein 1-like [Danaus plexippus]